MGVFSLFNKYKNTRFDVSNLFDYTFTPFGSNILDSSMVRSSIDYIANSIAKSTVTHTRPKSNGENEILNSEIIRVINCPNSYQNQFAFFYRLISELYISNNAFIYCKYDDRFMLKELHVLNYSDVQLKEKDNKLFATFRIKNVINEAVTMPYEELIHIRRHYNSKTFYADNSNKCLATPLETNNKVFQGIDNMIELSAKIKVVLTYAGVLKEQDKAKEIEKFKEMLEKGEGVAGIDGKATLSTLNVKPEVVDDKTFSIVKNTIYSFFGVTEELINGSASEQQVQNFYDQVVAPILKQLSDEFTMKLFTKTEIGYGNKILFSSQSMIFASLNTKTNLIKEMMGLGVLTINESRAVLGMPPIEGGNRRLQSLNFANVDMVDQYQTQKVTDKNTSKGGD